MTDPLTRLALEASSDQAAKRILEGGRAHAGSRLSAASEGSLNEVSPREREDVRRRDRHDDYVDPWGYPDPPLEPRDED